MELLARYLSLLAETRHIHATDAAAAARLAAVKKSPCCVLLRLSLISRIIGSQFKTVKKQI
jgi:hypothetical protein